jgi:hypothetical protein
MERRLCAVENFLVEHWCSGEPAASAAGWAYSRRVGPTVAGWGLQPPGGAYSRRVLAQTRRLTPPVRRYTNLETALNLDIVFIGDALHSGQHLRGCLEAVLGAPRHHQ